MSSWFSLEGRFDGITDRKELQGGIKLATFSITEEARGTQEASTFSVTGFKAVVEVVESLKVGTPVMVKCKLDSRSYKDRNGQDRRSTEIKAFAIYIGKVSETF